MPGLDRSGHFQFALEAVQQETQQHMQQQVQE